MPSSNGDRDITLSVGLDSTLAKKDSKELEKIVERTFAKSGTKKQTVQQAKLNSEIKKTIRDIKQVEAAQKAASEIKTPTADYAKLQGDLKFIEKEYEKAQNKIDDLESKGKKNTRIYEEWKTRLEQAKIGVDDVKEEIQDLVQKGKAFTLGDTAKQTKLDGQLVGLKDKLTSQLIRHKEINFEIDKQSKSVSKLTKNLVTATRQTSKMKKGVSGINIPFKGLTKTVLKYAFGIRSLYILVRRLKAALIDGFKNLIQFRDGNNALNKAVSELLSSLSQLKNNFAAAFAPIVTAIIPLITRLVTWINSAVEAISRLIAMLSGQSTWLRAKKVQQDYAKSLEKTGGAAKSASKQLAAFDKLNVLNSDNGGGGGGSGATELFEEVPLENTLEDFLNSDLIKKVKDKLKELWDLFKKGFFDALGDWKSRVQTIKDGLNTIKDVLIDIFTDPNVLKAMNNWANSFAYMLGTLTGMVAPIGLTIAANLVGAIAKYLSENVDRIKKYLISMFDIWSEINNQLAQFFIAFADVFSVFAEENGIAVSAALIGIFADAFMGVNELVSKSIRDIIILITQPFIDNKVAMRKAIDDTLGQIAIVLNRVKKVVDDTADGLNNLYDKHFKPLFENLTSSLSQFVATIIASYNQYFLPVWNSLTQNLDEFISQHVQPLINSVIEYIGVTTDTFKLLWDNVLSPFLNWFIGVFVVQLRNNLNILVNATKVAFAAISLILETALKVHTTFLKFIRDIFTVGWKKAWENVKQSFFNIWDGIVTKLKSCVNLIIDLINALLKKVLTGINKVFEGVNSIVGKLPDIGLPTLPTLSIPVIPKLAQGAVIPPNKEFLAMLGDQKQGTNIETPLSTMKQAFLEALRESGISGNDGEIVVNIDGDNLFTIMRDKDRSYKNRHGGRSAFSY